MIPNAFPFYTYNKGGTNRSENITDWALAEFRTHYQETTLSPSGTSSTTAMDSYITPTIARSTRRTSNAICRISRLPKTFWGFAEAGARLADLHVNYESQPEYGLKFVQNPDVQLNWRVEKIKLSKDKTSLIYNDFLTLSGIPPKAHDYRLGTRSALEWVIDQYRVKTDKRSGDRQRPKPCRRSAVHCQVNRSGNHRQFRDGRHR